MKKNSASKSNKFIPVNTPLITTKDISSVNRVLKEGWISSVGPEILKFESKMAKFTKRKYASCVSSGTAALEIAVKALDIGKNDEVIMPSFTIVSNAFAIAPSNINCDPNLMQKRVGRSDTSSMVPQSPQPCR